MDVCTGILKRERRASAWTCGCVRWCQEGGVCVCGGGGGVPRVFEGRIVADAKMRRRRARHRREKDCFTLTQRISYEQRHAVHPKSRRRRRRAGGGGEEQEEEALVSCETDGQNLLA
jgi:hypothetical protein